MRRLPLLRTTTETLLLLHGIKSKYEKVTPWARSSSIRPLQVKQTEPTHLSILWSDGHQGTTSLRTLRDACPCAGCNGETVLLHSYAPQSPDLQAPGRYSLKAVETVGGYALKFVWGDGHDMGLYTWEHLRGLCECAECVAKRTNVQSQNR